MACSLTIRSSRCRRNRRKRVRLGRRKIFCHWCRRFGILGTRRRRNRLGTACSLTIQNSRCRRNRRKRVRLGRRKIFDWARIGLCNRYRRRHCSRLGTACIETIRSIRCRRNRRKRVRLWRRKIFDWARRMYRGTIDKCYRCRPNCLGRVVDRTKTCNRCF